MLRTANDVFRAFRQPLPVVYVCVTTQMAIAELTDVLYERAFAAHWSDVFRFALAWTNDWGGGRGPGPGGIPPAVGQPLESSTGTGRPGPGCSPLPVASRRIGSAHFKCRLLPVPPVTPMLLDPGALARCLRGDGMSCRSLERAAIVMTAVEGAPYDEARVVLGTSAGALRAAVSRARTKLETA